MNEKTILIIDDEPSNFQIIVNIFKNSGYNFKIYCASEGKLGVEIAIQTLPDIIITDWEMPELNGIQVILELKKNIDTKEIPIIMSTGVKLTSENLKIALESGAFDFIRKPFDDVELIARTNSAIKFVDYYNQKIEHEKEIIKIKEDNFKNEIEAKKRELLFNTLILSRINNLYEKFQNEIEKSINSENLDLNKFVKLVKNHTSEMISSANKQIWSELELNFEQINDSFYKNIIKKFPNLTHNEKKLCAYLRLNLNTKEIASLTSQTYRAVEIARIRLRQKLGLTGTEEEIHTFLLNF